MNNLPSIIVKTAVANPRITLMFMILLTITLMAGLFRKQSAKADATTIKG